MIEDLKPYESYRASAVGFPPLPAHWGVRRTKSLLREIDRRTKRGTERLLSLRMNIGLVDHHAMGGKLIPSSSLVGYKHVLPGELVMNRMRAAVGLFGAATSEGLISPDYAIFSVAPELKVEYAVSLFKTPTMTSLFRLESRGLGTGESGFLRLYSDRFGILRMPLPPPEEQAAIVRFLDHTNRRIDQFIKSKQKLIALLNEQKQAIINRAVTRGLDPNVKLKDSGVPWLGVVPAHWEIRPLKGMAAAQSGITLGKDYGASELVEYPYVRVANVQAGRLALDRITTVRVPTAEAARSLLRAGDVLMTEGGDADKLGRGCVWQAEISPCLHQNHVFAVRPHQQLLLPFFLQTVLAAPYSREYFIRTAKQTTNLAATNKTTVGNHRVATPPLEEQKTILAALAEHLSPIDAALSMAGKDIGLMREYRTRLISDVVIGQLDVRAAAAALPDLEPDAAPTEPEGDDEDADIDDNKAA